MPTGNSVTRQEKGKRKGNGASVLCMCDRTRDGYPCMDVVLYSRLGKFMTCMKLRVWKAEQRRVQIDCNSSACRRRHHVRYGEFGKRYGGGSAGQGSV